MVFGPPTTPPTGRTWRGGGRARSLMPRRGNSPAHAPSSSIALAALGLRPPDVFVITHWH
jgi:hypothetical protein